MVIHTKGIKESSSLTYYCWKSATQRARARRKTGRQRGDVTHGCIQMVERESPLPRCRLSPPPPLLKASYISANDLRSFPDLASAIQRIMNNALTLKLQK